MSDIIGKNGKIFAVSKQINNSLENLSKIKENIFENRFMHVSELRRMGAKIEIKGNKAKIFGKSKNTYDK